ncbi:hypothetical protein Q7A_1639 [Methylophaga nitratireducenticrescens]|uniref:Uncharacterized protein n=1 Tax=Methylophaga nitratireducenticrescens TaxID=754476 RepID=I1XJ94_METNJ|nr:hypothetical protein [Methylophaga nitratireducenticrescens]AFI84463.1 hypothetical protein Q7A_1639 [Methylophaga nitratireducenticrescens]
MKNLKLAIAVSSALSVLASAQAMAAWENLPAAGVSVGSDTSAYILCNPTGDFGSGSGANAPVQPGSTASPCAVLPAFEIYAPDPNFSGADLVFKESRIVPINMNNSYTGGASINIGTLTEYIWEREIDDTDTYECIYGMKVVLKEADYNVNEPGVQNFEVNDMARKGWSGKTIDVAYSTVPSVASPTYRIGRTFTAVQHRPETGYVDQPITGLGSSPAINGVNVWPTPSGRPTAAEQKADIDTDWVNFTTDANFLDDDGSTAAASGMQYVRAMCTGDTHDTDTDAIRLRQTFQELNGDGVTDNPFIEVQVEGFIPN